VGEKINLSIALGSDKHSKRRKNLYTAYAKKTEFGNLARLIVNRLDKEIGLNLPLPRPRGRPPKKSRAKKGKSGA
jgi:hypothetical protein